MKIVAYTRVSTGGQIDGDGRERQQHAILGFCALHEMDWVRRSETEVDFFEAVSGTKDSANRPVFTDMLEFIVSSRNVPGEEAITGIVVERMDRLARDLIVSELLLMECQKLGIAVYSSDQGVPEDLAGSDQDPMRRFVRQVMAAAAQLDRAMIVKKLQIARRRVIARTGRCGGALAYGETAQEQSIIKVIQSYRSQGWSYHVIAKQLNLGELKPRRGKQWLAMTVKRVIDRHGKEGTMRPE